MKDNQDFRDQARPMTANRQGDMDRQITDHFALCGLRKRAAALDRIGSELRGEIGSGTHSLRRHVELVALRRRLQDVHHALRRAKR